MTPEIIATPDHEVDWAEIASMGDEQAAKTLDGRMVALERLSKRLFIERGMILLAFDERQLWRHLFNELYGAPFQSWGEWVAARVSDYSRRDCNYAKAVAKELRDDVPVADMLEIPRCNLTLMQSQLSSGVRRQREVIEAAKTLSEADFAEKVTKEHPECHVEAKKQRVFRMCDGDWAQVTAALDKVGELMEIEGREDELLALCIHFMQEHE